MGCKDDMRLKKDEVEKRPLEDSEVENALCSNHWCRSREEAI